MNEFIFNDIFLFSGTSSTRFDFQQHEFEPNQQLQRRPKYPANFIQRSVLSQDEQLRIDEEEEPTCLRESHNSVPTAKPKLPESGSSSEHEQCRSNAEQQLSSKDNNHQAPDLCMKLDVKERERKTCQKRKQTPKYMKIHSENYA